MGKRVNAVAYYMCVQYGIRYISCVFLDKSEEPLHYGRKFCRMSRNENGAIVRIITTRIMIVYKRAGMGSRTVE